MSRCVHCLVSGRVQGVFFRVSARDAARQLGVDGWARNLRDGRVEVLAAGPTEKVEAFCDWLRQGPPQARVDDVEITEHDDESIPQGFHVR